ncbi:MAG: HAMP domain-containing histidine kinase [Flavobacteriaceae bacterium]|nr:HAMP domain-containing histidine kinase [Flavobacteriaceae bacterium]
MRDKKHWKILLFLGAITIGFWSLIYTNKLVKVLQHEEAKKIKTYADALKLQYTIDDENSDALNFISELIKNNETIPMILSNDMGEIMGTVNIDTADASDLDYLKGRMERMKEQHEPLEIEYVKGRKQFIFYENSTILSLLKFYPLVQLAIITIFIFLSYLAFSASRRSEQNRVWVGLARETAHQLGTPISSMMAWIDYIKEADEHSRAEAIDELTKDVSRLELITERFSKIGSTPVLKIENLYDVMERSVDYIEKRVSKQVRFSIKSTHANIMAQLNISLFDWVVENLCKNAIDAMDGKGNIFIDIHQDSKHAFIDIKDTGKGISKNNIKTVFTPGFTTKKRGWGLGLSLAKRIIDNYHDGQIYVRDSELGKGTTFRIVLKK